MDEGNLEREMEREMLINSYNLECCNGGGCR